MQQKANGVLLRVIFFGHNSHESVAQSVEHSTFNRMVLGSSPSTLTLLIFARLMVARMMACEDHRGRVILRSYYASVLRSNLPWS